MSGYEYFEESVQILKQAAIDAWMVDVENFSLAAPGARRTRGAVYDHYQRPCVVGRNLGTAVMMNVSRPDASGRGGGDRFWYTDQGGDVEVVTVDYNTVRLPDSDILINEPNLVGQFGIIRDTIDRLVEPWRDLPSPARLSTVMQGFEGVATELGQGTLGSGGNLLIDCNDLVSTLNSSDIRGEAISNFRRAVIAKLDPKSFPSGGTPLKALCSIGAALTSHVAAEKTILEQARSQVSGILNSAFLGFSATAERSSTSDLTQWIDLARVAAQVAVEIIHGGKGLTQISQGLKLALLFEGQTPRSEKKVTPVGSYRSVMSTLKSSLQVLNEQIEEAESSLRDTVCQNLDEIGAFSNRSLFVLHPAPGEHPMSLTWTQQDYDDYNSYSRDIYPGNDHIRIIPADVADVKASLYAVAEDFRRIARMVETSHPEIWPALARDSRIGIGQNGPATALMELAELFHDLLGTFAWDVEESGDDLELACKDIMAQDEATRAALEAQAASMTVDSRMNVQSGIDLWDYDTRQIARPTEGGLEEPPTVESPMKW